MKISLTNQEVDLVTFNINIISDRQYDDCKLQDILEQKIYCPLQRVDMFWVECNLGRYDLGSFCIDPDLKDHQKFYVRDNYIMALEPQLTQLKNRVMLWFRNQAAYTLQQQYLEAIQTKYFTPVGGIENWIKMCDEARNKWEVEKKQAILKYKDMFEEFVKTEHPDLRKKLDACLKKEGVYRSNPLVICGFSHFLYLYQSQR